MAGLLVHEWLEKSGGAEKVLDEFAEAFPDADIQVLWNDDPGRHARKIQETWLARTPLRRHKALAVPILPAVWRRLRRETRPDWMLVSSHLFAHHVRLMGMVDVPKLVYAHTPARYIWEPSLDRRGNALPTRLAASVLKPIDRRRSRDALAVAANSEFTRERISRSWGIDAQVIYPPVDTLRIASKADWSETLSQAEYEVLSSLPAQFLLGASRFVSYKRLDLVIAAGIANDLPVVLAGAGPDKSRLLSIASGSHIPVHFVDRPSDNLLFALYQRTAAYIFPAIEDFGIMPVEAMAAGAPVIVPAVGGAAESVSTLRGGATFASETKSAWQEALAATMNVDRYRLPERTHIFSNSRFRSEIQSWVNDALNAPRPNKETNA